MLALASGTPLKDLEPYSKIDWTINLFVYD